MSVPNITAAVEVTPLWDQSSDFLLLPFLIKTVTYIRATDGPDCELPMDESDNWNWAQPFSMMTSKYYCPSRELNSTADFQSKIIKFYYKKVD